MIWLGIFAGVAVVMVLAMVAFTIELLSPSKDAVDHRERLRGLGPAGAVTRWLVPAGVERPGRYWGAVYFGCWAILLCAIGWMVGVSEPRYRLKNAVIGFGMAAGWLMLHRAIVGVGRAIDQANARAAEETEPAPESEEEESEHESDDDDSAPAEPSKSEPRFGVVQWVVVIGGLLAVRIAADHVPGLGALEREIRAHARVAAAVVGVVGVGGLLLFAGGCAALIRSRGRAMTPEELERFNTQMMRLSMGARSAGAAAYTFKGRQSGREAHDAFSLRAIKAAWRSGVWRSDPTWRRRYATFAGAMLMSVGLFGIFFVRGPAWVMLLCLAAMTYILIRTAWALAKA
jgi:hypothetical protein